MFHFGHHMHHGHPIVRLVVLVALIAAIAAAVLLVVRWRRGRGEPAGEPAWPTPPPTPSAGSTDPAMAALRSAYARGEVDRATFAERAADLGYPVPLPPEAPTSPATAPIGRALLSVPPRIQGRPVGVRPAPAELTGARSRPPPEAAAGVAGRAGRRRRR